MRSPRFHLACMAAVLVAGCSHTQVNTIPPFSFWSHTAHSVPLTVRSHAESTLVEQGYGEVKASVNGLGEQFTTATRLPDTSLELRFQHSWYSALHWDFPHPVDLSPYEQGALVLEMKVHEVQKAAMNIVVACGKGCSGKVRMREWAQAYDGKGWQRLSLPMTCFRQPGANYSAITRPITLEADGAGLVQIRNVQFTVGEKGSFDCPDQTTVSVTPQVLNEYWAVDWWFPRHKEKLAQLQQGPFDMVLIGDSITHGWEKEGAEVWQRHFGDVSTLNLGFSGDRTENVLWRFEQGQLDGLQPKLMMVMIGTNNTGGRGENPGFIINGIRAMLDEISERTPHTEVLLLSIFPRGMDANDPLRINNQVVNRMLPALAAEYGAIHANINAAFLEADGTLSNDIMPDLLHPNSVGYERWAEQLKPYVDRYIRGEQ